MGFLLDTDISSHCLHYRMRGDTGLIFAMCDGNPVICRVLLGSNRFKLDTKEEDGMTALHAACEFNRIECVKLFLEHPTCNKDIVRMVDNSGETAELLADRKGNKAC